MIPSPLSAVTALTTMAKQLKAAMDAAVDNEENARHLFERLRDNSHLVSAALMEGLSSPNPHLQAAIHNTIERITDSLMQARNTIYQHLISKWMGGKLSFGNVGGLIRANEIQRQLKRAHERLDRDLADLRGLVSLETWRLVSHGEGAAAAGGEGGRGGGGGAGEAAAAAMARMPSEAADQLAELRAVADIRAPAGAASKVVKQVARMVVGSPRDQQAAAEKLRCRALTCPDHRAALTAAGGIPVLVQLMSSSASEAVQRDAAALLASLAADGIPNQAVMIVMGGIQALTGLMLSNNPQLQNAAADALHVLAFNSRTPAAASSVAGGIAALVSLLEGSRQMAQEAAAAALAMVAATDVAHAQAGVKDRQSYQPAIVAVGGVPALVRALDAGRAATREGAAATLRCMATVSRSNRGKIKEAGGIPALVQLLCCSGEAAQSHAIAVLTVLADSSPSNKAAIAAAGGIPALVRLLGCGCEAVQEGAAAALGTLAAGNPDSKNAIAASGGIAALAQLLRSTCVPVQDQAGNTLDVLALNHPQNQQAIAAVCCITHHATHC